MILSLRTFVIVFLVMLQSIAPLVHAHTGEKIFDKGLHIPGIETYGQHIEKQSTLVHKSAYHTHYEGVLVSVNTSLKTKYSAVLDDLNSPDYITPSAVAIKTTLSAFDTNFSPHAQHLVAQFFVSAHPARAPPQYTLA